MGSLLREPEVGLRRVPFKVPPSDDLETVMPSMSCPLVDLIDEDVGDLPG